MPSFAYKGLNARGKQVSGRLDAESPRSLRATLRKDGVYLTAVHEAREKVVHGKGLKREVDLKGFFDRVKPQDVAIITRQLATLLRAGIPLTESLSALTEQATSEKFGRTLADVRTKVNEGTSLGDALSNHPKVFPELYVNMVRAGETAGNLDTVLARLADFLDGQVRLKSTIISALTYPVIVAAVGCLITALLMIVVVPNVTQIFEDTGKALPWNTELLIFVSKITGNWWWLIIILMVLGYYLFRHWKRTPKGKQRWDSAILKLWVIGPLVRMIAIARFARTLGTMLNSGVPLLTALEIVKAVVGNAVLTKVLDNAKEAIREGESLAGPLEKSGHFPPVVTRMIAVGERSGQLESMLETVAQSYEAETALKVERLTRLMEPLAILLMGGAVGFIVFSILMPILEMNEMIG
ncbi:MAG: type II secretion system inner membrane protein GspF [Pseudomonadota bacterium]